MKKFENKSKNKKGKSYRLLKHKSKHREKVLSFLSRCCASGNQGIFAPASCSKAHIRRFLNLIRRSLEFFAFAQTAPAKNRDDSFFVASPRDLFHRHSEPKAKNPKNHIKDWILRFANTPLRMTIPALALLFTLITTTESWAACDNGYILKNGRCIIACGYKYTACEECYYDNDGNPTGCKRYPCGYKYRACSECSYNEDGSGPIACIKIECASGYEAKNGRCIEGCGHKYSACSECSYDEDGSGPIACIKCGYGFRLKNGTCTWGAPGTSCGDGYVDGDGVCYKIPDGCESASATDGSCIKCSDGLSLDDDNNCIECNKEGYKNVGGYCNRVRYTPAEAAQWLNEDDNTVTLTFKKQ